MNYVYIVECRDGTLYTGWTNDLQRRVNQHNSGKGGNYTRSRCPVNLRYFERFPTKQEAMRREWQIKKLSRAEKIKLLETIGGRG
jgi:putative endonuclease